MEPDKTETTSCFFQCPGGIKTQEQTTYMQHAKRLKKKPHCEDVQKAEIWADNKG